MQLKIFYVGIPCCDWLKWSFTKWRQNQWWERC